MNDFQTLRNAQTIIDKGDADKAWDSLNWIFCSTDLEPDSFYQVATRQDIDPERFKTNLLERSKIARDFYYGENEYKGEYAGANLEAVK